MKQIFCEHPVIIRNPQLKELLITHRCYTTLTGDHYISFAQANYFKYRFPDYQFSPRRFKVTLDNIDRFNVFNEKTGEVFPMFIQVMEQLNKNSNNCKKERCQQLYQNLHAF